MELRMNRNQQVHDILISVAVADAIGADIEFMSKPTKHDFYRIVNGPQPLRVTDDTQMSLFTAEALLRGYKKNEFQEAYLCWYKTQIANLPILSCYSLMSEPVLYSQRAPGHTCMGSMREIRRHKSRSRNDSKGNGTVMRCFPLVPFVTVENLENLVADCTYATHDHEFAFWATKLAVSIGKGLSAGLALNRLLRLYQKQLGMINQAHPEQIKCIEQIGRGWVAEEALMIALWALWHGRGDWLKTVELAVVHPGDSDTTGAIVGGFLGCMGVMPPDSLQTRVDVLGVIERLVARYPQEVENTV